jgi:hypothetical protein
MCGAVGGNRYDEPLTECPSFVSFFTLTRVYGRWALPHEGFGRLLSGDRVGMTVDELPSLFLACE